MEKMDKKLQLRIGKKLRKIASDIAAEPIPPRFAHLVGPDDPPPFGGASAASSLWKNAKARPPIEAPSLRYCVAREERRARLWSLVGGLFGTLLLLCENSWRYWLASRQSAHLTFIQSLVRPEV